MVKEEVNDPNASNGAATAEQKQDEAAPAPAPVAENQALTAEPTSVPAPAPASAPVASAPPEEPLDDKNLEPEQFRKMFIGGLTASTSDEMLRDYYSQWGELVDCVVMRDPNTKRSRGFGFVSYSKQSEVDLAMSKRPHVIDNKSVDPKRAVPREQSQRTEANISSKRLYVSGVRDEHSEEMFMSHFGKFGNVQKAEIIMDKNTGKPRGFAFITFDDYDAVDKCVLQKSHMINNYRCDVKKALSKEEMNKAQQSERERMERGNRSRGNFRDRQSWGGGGYERGSSNFESHRNEAWGTTSAWGPSGGQGSSGGWGGPGGRGAYGGKRGNQSGGYGGAGGYGGSYPQSANQSWSSDGWAQPWGGQGWGGPAPGGAGAPPAWQGGAGGGSAGGPTGSWNQNPPSGGHSAGGWGNRSGY